MSDYGPHPDAIRIRAYWKAHPAQLSGKTVNVLVGQRIENEAILRAVAPHVLRTWPSCARKTINELRQITGWDYNDTKTPSVTPHLTKEERQLRVLEGMAATLRKAGWTVTPPED